MKPDTTKNYYLALALSILVVIGWNYFVTRPQVERARQSQSEVASGKTLNEGGRPGAPNALPPQTINSPPQGGVLPQTIAVQRDRRAALAESQRVDIDTPSLLGSISLTGARFDDLALKDYRETPNKNSPDIVLLSPSGAPSAYYSESGFVAQGGATLALPGPTTVWTKTAGDKLTPTTPVTLSWDNGQGLVFTRKVSVDKDYMFTVSTSVDNKGTAPVSLVPYALINREGTPKTSGYSVLHEGYIGYVGNAEDEIAYNKIEKETNSLKKASGVGGWAGFTDQYWATAIVPDQSKTFEADFSATGSTEKTYQTATFDPALAIAPGASATTTSRLFAGAKVVSMLNAYEKDLGIKQFNLMIDWGTYLWFFTQKMFWLLNSIYKIVGNYGLAIILVTFLVKLVFFPLANRSYMSMAKMKAVQPQLAALKERYPDDKVKQQQEMMAIYKREKIQPILGCLPMLIQIPVFFSLYKVLFVSIEMRQAPFALWIRDLSQPDPTNIFNLFGLIPYDPTKLPLIGHFLAIGILPLIMGISMFLQMKMNPEPTDPVQKTIFSWMPVIFTFMLGTFPSGLVLYWTANNTLTIIQQSVIMKRAGVKLELFDNLLGMIRPKPKRTSAEAIAESKAELRKLDALDGTAPGE